MDHPNIAKVLDGGLHDGRPYFVMELVKGVPITQFCDERKLTPAQRLELFVPVCQAIQHAHQKGIIHRDIKPSNVLIALYDDKPVPKVIDFGIAKATGGALTDKTFETAFGGVVGTPQYMSPEQASLNNLDIDTRSDVYSLGVLLYELLTGSPPFARKELQKAGLLEILRVVREEEPPRPSHKLSTADALPSLSASRGMEPKKLTGLLRNELDWIVVKALEKDRTRRYDTANGFAADVTRYLSGEAVQAHPPSAAYRVRKFVRRNRGPMVAAGLVLASLLLGIAGTTFGLFRAEQRRVEAEQAKEREAEQRRLAEANAVDARQQEAAALARKAEAENQAAIATAVREFLQKDILGLASAYNQASPSGKVDPDIRVRTALDMAAQKVADRFRQQPLVEASIRVTLAQAYYAIGQYAAAVAQRERAAELYLHTLGPEARETIKARTELAFVYGLVAQHSRAEAILTEILPPARSALGPAHADTLQVINYLAMHHTTQGQYAKAEALLTAARDACAQAGKETAFHISGLDFRLANLHMRQNRYAEAAPIYAASIEEFRRHKGNEYPDTLINMQNLGVCYRGLGRYAEAESLFKEVLDIRRRTQGSKHPGTADVMNSLAVVYTQWGLPARAEPLLKEALESGREAWGPDSRATLNVMGNLGWVYHQLGRHAEATPLLTNALESKVRLFGSDHPDVVVAQYMLGQHLLDVRRFTEAEPVLRTRLETLARTSPDGWDTYVTKSMFGGALLGQKKYADAEPQLLAGYEGLKRSEKLIPKSRKVNLPNALDRLVELYTATNKPDEVKKYKDLRAEYRETLPPPRAESHR